MGLWQASLPSWEPPLLWATFDGNPDRLALFLSQVISHLDRYTHLYPSQWAMVMAVTAMLEGEAIEWVAYLHSEHVLRNAGLFLEALNERFKDATRAQWVEGEILI